MKKKWIVWFLGLLSAAVGAVFVWQRVNETPALPQDDPTPSLKLGGDGTASKLPRSELSPRNGQSSVRPLDQPFAETAVQTGTQVAADAQIETAGSDTGLVGTNDPNDADVEPEPTPLVETEPVHASDSSEDFGTADEPEPSAEEVSSDKTDRDVPLETDEETENPVEESNGETEEIDVVEVDDEPGAATVPDDADVEPDDLTEIGGIGIRMASFLHEHGIYTFVQLANVDDVKLAEMENDLGTFSGRIKRDRWIEQAAERAAE